MLIADHEWRGRWVRAADRLRELSPGTPVDRISGTIVPPLRDHHVHLGLVDARALRTSALSEVDDLGWILEPAQAWRRQGIGGCSVRIAGPFLTAPGGYPVGRSWAPPGSTREISDADDAITVIRMLARAGVDAVKIALHADLPTLDDRCLAVLAGAAARAELPVIVHAEGAGQVERAAAIAPYALAHTPWTEALPDRLITAMAGRTAWITTLAIHRGSHGSAVAGDNLRRFAAAGGMVLYGTDLGNGPGPVDLRSDEVAAMINSGLDQDAVLASLCRGRPADGVVTWTPYAPVNGVTELAEWTGTLRRRQGSDPRREGST